MSNDIEINSNIELDNLENLDKQQNNFLESTLGQVIDSSVDLGLRAILPNFIEDEVIEIKDTLIKEGFPEAVNKAIDSAIDIGKSALGIVTGKFESVSQAEKAVEKGGIVDSVSDVLDFTLDKVSDMGLLSKNITKVIKSGKDALIDNVSSDIKKEFKTQNKNIENLNKYNNNWKESFEAKDFSSMEKYMKKINNLLNKTLPLENTIKNARTIENLHELIKNNGKSFELTNEELQLAELLG
jgi:hypothetical protein